MDDFGVIAISARGHADLLELLDGRVGNASAIMLGQMPVKDWHSYTNGPALADAILERLKYSSVKLARVVSND